MNASQIEEEKKIENFAERDFSESCKKAYNKVVERLTVKKTDCNTFGSGLRIFKVPEDTELGFPVVQQIRLLHGRGIASLYIFKMQHPVAGGFTHGIYVRLQGFVHRRYFQDFIVEMIKTLVGKSVELRSVVPVINKSVSLFDYLQTLYVTPANLLVNFSHHLDAVAETQRNKKMDTGQTGHLKNRMHSSVSQIIDTMIAMPAKYPQSYLSQLLAMPVKHYRRHMRMTNINDVIMKIGQDAYNIALQDTSLKTAEVQELMQPITRRAMLNRVLTDKVTKPVQLLFQQTFQSDFVHPHPYNGIVASELSSLKPLDGLVFDPRFMFTLILVSRWFARACMLDDDASSNNYAHLLLYGASGTGKTLITSAIASSIPTYKYLVNSRFQNPDLLQASLLAVDEFDTQALPTNQYKALLDLKSHIKIDFKNLHPENVTEGVPCMMTTNDDVFSQIRNTKKFSAASIDAALRRMYIIPMKYPTFDKLHGQLSRQSTHYETLYPFISMFEREQYKLQRMFNLIVAIALYQQDITGLFMDARLYDYFRKISFEFSQSTFGSFYLQNKESIDRLVIDAEETMKSPDCDDATYLVKVASNSGQFHQLYYQFIDEHTRSIADINPAIIKDNSIPWTNKAYYLLHNYSFIIGLMREEGDNTMSLNPEVRAFLNSAAMQKFLSESDHDVDCLSDIFQSERLSGEKRTFAQMLGVENEMIMGENFQELIDQ